MLYVVVVVVFWVIELVYNVSFMLCLEEGFKILFEFFSIVKRWGSLEFYEYILSLKKLVDNVFENVFEGE